MLENRMLLDSEFVYMERPIDAQDGLSGSGYENIHTGQFVPHSKAYKYALETLEFDEDVRSEFVEWFYDAYNWKCLN